MTALGLVLVFAGAFAMGVRARRTFPVDTIGVPLVGVNVVVSVTTSACCVRSRRPALLSLQVIWTAPAVVMVLSMVQTVMVEARVLRRLVRTVPMWRTLPGPGAVNVVTIVVVLTMTVLVVGRAMMLGGVVVPAPGVVPLFVAAVGVTAFDAPEANELKAGVVVLATAVKV